MPAFASSRAPDTPASQSQPQAAQQQAAVEPESGTPEWLERYSLTAGNAATLEALLGGGLSADEATATSLLDGVETAPVATDPASVEAAQGGGGGPGDGGVGETTPTPTHAPSGTMGAVYRKNDTRTDAMKLSLTASQKNELAVFKKNWEKNHGRYEAVAAKTGVPAKLIAAIHYRESSLNFGTYLHQGDPLGKKAVHHPSNIPIFYVWEEAAVHALNMKKSIRDGMGMDETTTDPTALATYAEAYNGLGYHNRGKASPYVYSGTNQYSGGRYVRDGVYDPRSWDQRLGVLALVDGLDGADTGPAATPGQSEDEAWEVVLDGSDLLKVGVTSPAVTALQRKLTAAGYTVPATGYFGPMTKGAVERFQKARGLPVDGKVGAGTARALDGRAAPTPETPAATPTNPEWARTLAGGHLISRGAQGDHVKLLQELLTARGFPVTVDGDFGGRTLAAVKAFQRANGLGVDGVVGRATAQKLEA